MRYNRPLVGPSIDGVFKVPWKLYHNSRPRTSRSLKQAVQDARSEFAHSELRAQELFFLVCTVIAPFLGAFLIRYVFSALEGVDSLSWFSTTLFVLATGIRPWTHLVSRLQQRTNELHQAVHRHDDEDHDREVDENLTSLMKRVDALERTLREVQVKADRISPLQEVCDDISEALETVERNVHRQERKTESARVTHNNRLAAVEEIVVRLERHQNYRTRSTAPHAYTIKNTTSLPLPLFPLVHRLRRIFESYGLVSHKLYLMDPLNPAPLTSPTPTPPVSPSAATQVFSGTPLETIPEAADSDSEGPHVSGHDRTPHSSTGKNISRPIVGARKPSRSRSRSTNESRPSLVNCGTYRRIAQDYVSAIISWPHRFATRILLIIVPAPMKKYFV